MISLFYKKFCLIVCVWSGLMAGVAIPVLAQDNLVKSSDFAGVAEAGGLPSGWIKGSAGLVTVETEGGATFLRLVSEQPDQLVEVSQEILIPAEIKGLDYTASFRTAVVKFGWLCSSRRWP